MKISIVIPTYEAKGHGVSLLNDLITSIEKQTYNDIEVIISDQSKDNEIENYLSKLNNELNIIYHKTTIGLGNSSCNMNEGIKIATGDFIKIMHMDDYFYNDNAIDLMVKSIETTKNPKWGAFTFNHLYQSSNSITRVIKPHYYHNPVINQNSLIGCPSVSFFINDKTNLFDENTIIINDFIMHYNLTKKYGEPIIIDETSITIRIHDSQVTNILDDYQIKEKKEADYFNSRYMENDFLTKLANKYASDKGTEIPNDNRHHGPRLHFTPVYNSYMNTIRYEKLNILEIGIGSGPSLKMFYEYFPNATIHAIDIVNQSQHNNDRVKTYICDQSNREQLENVMKSVGEVDLIFDDGSHVITHQQISLGVLFKYLKNGGQYWVEDLHTSDHDVWNGKTLYGYDMSFTPGESTVDVLEKYIETKNFYSPFLLKDEIDYINQNVNFMRMFELPKTFYGVNKLCLIKK